MEVVEEIYELDPLRLFLDREKRCNDLFAEFVDMGKHDDSYVRNEKARESTDKGKDTLISVLRA